MLSVYTGRYFGLTYIRCSDVPVSVESGRYNLYPIYRILFLWEILFVVYCDHQELFVVYYDHQVVIFSLLWFVFFPLG